MTELLEEVQLAQMSLGHFAEALAAASPRPAGSCAAVVPGALAAALVAKVARLSAQSDPFGDLDFDMEDVASEADLRRAQLLHLADEDRDGFDRVMMTRRLPSATPEQEAVRGQEIQRAYEAAVEPPLRACGLSLRVLQLAVEVAERGNPHAASDAGVAALLAAATVGAAALTVELSLGPVEDEDFRSAHIRDARAARDQASALLERALKAVRVGRAAIA